MPAIVAAATAFPPHAYPQEAITERVRTLWADRPDWLDRLDAFHGRMGVKTRHLALPLEAYGRGQGFGERNAAWTVAAVDLGEAALQRLFTRTGIQPREVSLLAFTTVTGIAVPSIDARLMNRLPFAPSLKRLPLFGLGCLAGVAGVTRLADYLEGHPRELAVLLSVELCSLTFQADDASMANLVGTGLFGDAAAAVLMAGREHPLAGGRPRVVDGLSVFFPDTERVMGWDVTDAGFRLVLGPEVPQFALKRLPPELSAFLSRHAIAPADVSSWIAHPGGPKVIEALEAGLGLSPEALAGTRRSLAEAGNLSSASVLHVLEGVLSAPAPPPGSHGVMLAMGPAFSAEAALLRW